MRIENNVDYTFDNKNNIYINNKLLGKLDKQTKINNCKKIRRITIYIKETDTGVPPCTSLPHLSNSWLTVTGFVSLQTPGDI